MEQFVRNGQQLLNQSGVRQYNRETMLPLFRALHGEISPDVLTPNLRGIHDDIKAMAELEEREMLDFLLDVQDSPQSRMLTNFDAERFVDRIMASDSYFPRGWKQAGQGVRGIGRGRMGGTPEFVKQRVDGTFSELLDSGMEPTSWNPYNMMALRRIAGIEYRESVKLVNRLHTFGKALQVSEAPDNWKVPRVGPVFEGRPIPDANVEGGLTFSEPIAVPADVAGFLESAFGRVPDVRMGDRNIVPFIRQWSNAAKRLKLVGSLFQHVDFATRSLGVAFTPTGHPMLDRCGIHR